MLYLETLRRLQISGDVLMFPLLDMREMERIAGVDEMTFNFSPLFGVAQDRKDPDAICFRCLNIYTLKSPRSSLSPHLCS